MAQLNQVDNFNDSLVTPNKQPTIGFSTPIQPFASKDLTTLQTVDLAYALPTPASMTETNNMVLIDQSPVPQNPFNLSGDPFAQFYEPIASNNCYYTPVKDTTSDVMASLTAYTSIDSNSCSAAPVYTSIVLNIPTEYTTITSAMPPAIMSTRIQPESVVNSVDLNVLNAQVEAGPAQKRAGNRHKRYRYKNFKFDEEEAAQTQAKVSIWHCCCCGFNSLLLFRILIYFLFEMAFVHFSPNKTDISARRYWIYSGASANF